MGILAYKKAKKKGKMKKKPVNYSKYQDFAQTLDSSEIEIPTLQTNTSNVSVPEISSLINYFESWLGSDVPPALPFLVTIYTFTKKTFLSSLMIDYINSAAAGEDIQFHLAIIRGSTILLRFDFHYLSADGKTLKYDKEFSNLVLQSGDYVRFNVDSMTSAAGTTHEMRIKGVLN